MTRFIGGPYDSLDLNVNAQAIPKVRLPEFQSVDGMMLDALLRESSSGFEDWPHVYEADLSQAPPVFRFVGEFDVPGYLSSSAPPANDTGTR